MKNFLKDLLLFIVLVCVYLGGRLVLLWTFNANAETPSFNWLLMSLRFDGMTAAFLVLPTFLVSAVGLIFSKKFPRIKHSYATLATFASICVAIVNVCFFFEYKSQFNYWIFGIFFDDLHAITASIWKAYPVIWILCSTATIGIALWYLFRAIFRKIDAFNIPECPRRHWKILIPALCALALIAAMRGGRISGRPVQLRDAAVEPSEFLNNLIPSSAYCIKNEISKFIASSTKGGLKHFSAKESDIPSFVHDLYGENCPSLDAALERTASGPLLKTRPKRIFFIIGEGHSAWPTYDRFQKYGLMPQTRALYETSFYCRRTLPSGGGTMASVSSLISGIPYTGLDVRGVCKTTPDCAIAPILRRLGYSSTFFYAGQSTWLGLGEFAKFNGFARVIGGESMGDLYGSVEWGLRDKDMFNYILKHDIAENTFNMILTASNHPPFDVDLRAEGCPTELKNENDVRLYHMWYADKEIGRFVKEVSKKYPDSIIIITGDHPARTTPPEEKMTSTELACVPLIFTGAPIRDTGLANNELLQSQYLDALPTLTDMLAPKGFSYKAWGSSLFSTKRTLPPMTPTCFLANEEAIPYNSAACPPAMQELARKFHALAYYKSNIGGPSRQGTP